MTTADAFSAFNARAVPATVIARTFIAPRQFATLTRTAHTIVVGPRGSGKTTLLKMLTPEALTDPLARDVVAGLPPVDFTGIFVPTDINWSRQLDAYRALDLPASSSESLVRACFTTAVLRAFTSALQQRQSASGESPAFRVRELNLTPEAEASFVALIAESWRVEPKIPSLLGLRAALSQRLVDLAEFALAEHRIGPEGRSDRFEANRDLDLPMLPSLSTALDLLEAFAPDLMGERWALLFDELELAPQEIRSELLQALRSVDDRFLFKLSLSPFSAEFGQLTTALSAMPGHDHDEISLSYGRKEDGLAFSLALMEAMVRNAGHGPADLPSVLGRSDFPEDGTWAREPVDSQSEVRALEAETARVKWSFRQLYETDTTFRRFADKHGGDFAGYMALEGDKRAQVLRKVVPIVVVRAAFRAPDGPDGQPAPRRFKTRKNPDLYRGYTSIATLLEGNPRYIIGVMNALLADWEGGRIPGHRQASEIGRTANRFRALLTTLPGPPSMTGRRAMLSIVDMIGEFFRESIIADDFTPDPSGSFIVDSTASESLLSALGDLVNQGALVYVPDPDGGPIMTSLRGKRFRLNYLLASQYGLPLRLERGIALSRVLAGRRSLGGTDQDTLFGDQEV